MDLGDLFSDLLKASPGLAVAVILVVLFLRWIERREKATMAHFQELHDEAGERTKRCHAVQDRSTDAVNKVEKRLGELTVAITAMNGRHRATDSPPPPAHGTA